MLLAYLRFAGINVHIFLTMSFIIVFLIVSIFITMQNYVCSIKFQINIRGNKILNYSLIPSLCARANYRYLPYKKKTCEVCENCTNKMLSNIIA